MIKKIFVVIFRLMAILILCAIPLSAAAQSKPTRDKSKDVVRVSPAKPKTSGVKKKSFNLRTIRNKRTICKNVVKTPVISEKDILKNRIDKDNSIRADEYKKPADTTKQGVTEFYEQNRNTEEEKSYSKDPNTLLVNNMRYPQINVPSSKSIVYLNVHSMDSNFYCTNVEDWYTVSRVGNNRLSLSVKANNSTKSRSDSFYVWHGTEKATVWVNQEGDSSLYARSKHSTKSNDIVENQVYKKDRFVTYGVGADVETNFQNGLGSELYYSLGLAVQLGKASQFVNVITGISYRWIMVSPEYRGSDSWFLYGSALAIPLDFRFNIAKVGQRSAFFIGIGAEYGVVFDKKQHDERMGNNELSIYPSVGLRIPYFDFSLYWKTYLNGPFCKDISERNKEFKSESLFGIRVHLFF